VTWAITAQPGAGWGEGEDAQGNWPLSVVQGDTAATRVRAAAIGQPSTIVIELGSNDALRASFAVSSNNGPKLLARLVGTDNNIRSVVNLASSLSRCVVLVSPSYYPTMTFSEEQIYSGTALQLRTVLLKEASSAPQHTVLVADWAALSSTHLLAAGSPENWFTADRLHPNSFGLRALADLIVRTARGCPS
jgi:lysophospholipase L1-like esterase